MMFRFEDLPEPIQEILRSQQDRQEMAETVGRQEAMRFLEELTLEQVALLAGLLAAAGEEPHVAWYYKGILDSRLHREGYCFTHGTECPNKIPTTDEVEYETEPKAQSDLGEVDRDEALKLYRVESLNTAKYGDTRVQCVDCGYMYPSLKDRKLRSPDSCPGCEQKAKFG